MVDAILALLANGIHPVVPEQGSVGASGDLAPLAHLALPLIGRGQVEVAGTVEPAAEALRGGRPRSRSSSRRRKASPSSTGRR